VRARTLGYEIDPELMRKLVIASPEGAKQSKDKIASSLDKLGTKP
jgi:hypothetical protein